MRMNTMEDSTHGAYHPGPTYEQVCQKNQVGLHSAENAFSRDAVRSFQRPSCLGNVCTVIRVRPTRSILSAGSAIIPKTITKSSHPNGEARVLRAHPVS